MFHRTFQLFALALCILLPLVGGCGKRLYRVTGRVLDHKGEPIPAGTVYFDPDPENKDAPQGFARIEDGTFTTTNLVAAGLYRIRIQAFDGKVGDEMPLGKPIGDPHEQDVDLPAADSAQSFIIDPTKPAPKRGELPPNLVD